MSDVASTPQGGVTVAGVAAQRADRLAEMPMQEAGPRGNFFTGPIYALADLFRHRELLDLLVRRELKSRYKDSALGFLWSLVRPLTQLLIYALVLGEFLGAARSTPNFAIFIFTGLTIYGLFSEVVMVMTASIVANGGLVKKVYLPREIFPVATIGSALFNFGIQLVILVLASALTGSLVFGTNLLYFPLAILVALIWAAAIGLALAALNVSLRDMQYLVEIVVLLLMWFSPIVYQWSFVGGALGNLHLPSWLADLYLMSPLTLAVIGFQEVFWRRSALDPNSMTLPPMLPDLGVSLVIAAIVGLVALWFSQRLFAKMEGNFAQEL